MNLENFYRITNYLRTSFSGVEPFIKQTLLEHGGRVSLKLNGDEELDDNNFPVCSIFEGRHDKPYIRITSVYVTEDRILVDGYDDETKVLRIGFGVYENQLMAVTEFLGHVLQLKSSIRQSHEFNLRQDAFKAEMIACIKRALPESGDKIPLDKDQFYMSIGYYIDCECFDDLTELYVCGERVMACLCTESENAVELEYFHERSLIEIIDYLERHGYLEKNMNV